MHWYELLKRALLITWQVVSVMCRVRPPITLVLLFQLLLHVFEALLDLAPNLLIRRVLD